MGKSKDYRNCIGCKIYEEKTSEYAALWETHSTQTVLLPSPGEPPHQAESPCCYFIQSVQHKLTLAHMHFKPTQVVVCLPVGLPGLRVAKQSYLWVYRPARGNVLALAQSHHSIAPCRQRMRYMQELPRKVLMNEQIGSHIRRWLVDALIPLQLPDQSAVENALIYK